MVRFVADPPVPGCINISLSLMFKLFFLQKSACILVTSLSLKHKKGVLGRVLTCIPISERYCIPKSRLYSNSGFNDLDRR